MSAPNVATPSPPTAVKPPAREPRSSDTPTAFHTSGPDEVPSIGHNAVGLFLSIELRLFNRLYRRFGDGAIRRRLDVPVGTTLGELVAIAGIPESEVFIAFVNGRDTSVGPGELRAGLPLQEADVVALSGPVPYSWGYGAPVV